jgi:hypothetical protein
MGYELTDYEWAAIRPMLPNKPRGVIPTRICLFSFKIDSRFLGISTPVCTEKLDSDVLVMKPPDQGMRHDATDRLNRARDRRIFV